jgi:uncharacterized membrane protein
MESKAKIFGHAIHPILIVFPLGLLSTAIVFDVIYLITGSFNWTTVSFWMIFAGLVGGALAAIFGAIDLLAIPSNTRAKRIGVLHGLINVAMMLLFAVSLLLRYQSPEFPPTNALVFSFTGAVLAALGGWLGGELVERLGVGVDSGANLNAPSSLTHRHVARHPGPEIV